MGLARQLTSWLKMATLLDLRNSQVERIARLALSRLGLNSAAISEDLISRIFSKGDFNFGVRPNIIDIGANRGEFSTLLVTMYMDARIIAIEPQPELIEEIERLGLDQVITICAAVVGEGSPSNGFLRRRYVGDERAHLSQFKDAESDDISVQLMTLDRIMRENFESNECVDLLKVDAEGWDFDIIKGSEALLKTNRVKLLLFEIDFRTLLRGYSFHDIEVYLREVGFPFLYRTSKRWGLIPLLPPLRSDLAMTQNIVASRTPL